MLLTLMTFHSIFAIKIKSSIPFCTNTNNMICSLNQISKISMLKSILLSRRSLSVLFPISYKTNLKINEMKMDRFPEVHL